MLYIRTSDIFNIADERLAEKCFKDCYKKALKCGLICKVHIRDTGFKELFIEGPKSKIVKYYFATLGNNKRPFGDIKRLFDIIATF